MRSARADAGGRRAEGPALRGPRAGDALGARRAARAQGPRDRGARPRVARARPLHRGAREGADAAREPGGGARSRTRGSTTSSRGTTSGSRASCGSPGTSSTRSSPRARPAGAGLGGLGPLPTRPRAGGRPLRLLRHGRRACSASRPATWPARASPPRSTRPSPRVPSARAPSSGGRRPDLMRRVNRTLRRRGIEGLFCTLAYALFDFQDRSLRLANSGPAPPPPLPRRPRGAREPLAGGRPAPRDLRRRRLRRARGRARGRGTSSSSTSTGSSRRGRGRRSTGRSGSAAASRSTPHWPAPELGERLLADLEDFLGTKHPMTTSRSSSSRYSDTTGVRRVARSVTGVTPTSGPAG